MAPLEVCSRACLPRIAARARWAETAGLEGQRRRRFRRALLRSVSCQPHAGCRERSCRCEPSVSETRTRLRALPPTGGSRRASLFLGTSGLSAPGPLGRERGDQFLRRDRPVALFDPLTKHVFRRRLFRGKMRRDPPALAQAIARRLGEREHQRHGLRIWKLHRKRKGSIRMSHEDENLLAHFHDALAPGKIFVRLGEPQRKLPQGQFTLLSVAFLAFHDRLRRTIVATPLRRPSSSDRCGSFGFCRVFLEPAVPRLRARAGAG